MQVQIQDVLIDNEYMKQIRLVDGVLINIYKCEFGYDISSYIKRPRTQLNKMEDYFYMTKEVLMDTWRNKDYPIGTVLYKLNTSYYPIIKINDKKDWEWEIKTTGNAFSGNSEYFRGLVECILELIEKE